MSTPLLDASGAAPESSCSLGHVDEHAARRVSLILKNGKNLGVLCGLRLALPYIFHPYRISALHCIFNGPRDELWREVRSLHRFLVGSNHEAASTIEAVTLKCHPSILQYLTEAGYESIPHNVFAFRDLLGLFIGTTAGQTCIHRCSSLNLLNCRLYYPHWQPLMSIPPPVWVSPSEPLATPSLWHKFTFMTMKVLNAVKSRPSTTSKPRLHTLNLDSDIVFLPPIRGQTLDMLSQNSTSIRCLSFSIIDAQTLARITLPNLEELSFRGHISPAADDLAVFLVRHPSLRVLDLGTAIGSPVDWWRQPRGFLPNLSTIKGSPQVLYWYIHPRRRLSGSAMPLPALRSITLILHLGWAFQTWAFTHNNLIDLHERLTTLSLTLQLHVTNRNSEWLRDDYVIAQMYEGVKCIEIDLRQIPDFFGIREVKALLVKWLAKFPLLSTVLVVGKDHRHLAESDQDLKELFEMITTKYPQVIVALSKAITRIRLNLLNPMDAGPPRLPRRNVEVFDADGNVIAGFWQYGTLQWDEFYRYITAFIVTTTEWAIFQYDSEQQQRGAECPPSSGVVQPGHYVLLSTSGEATRVGLVAIRTRNRIPTHSNTPVRESHYRTRTRNRDGKCLITGQQTQTYSRLKVAHIFPRAHDVEWIRKGYRDKITDPAEEAVLGGSSKIDSIQNTITLRSDLHDAWDNYEFGVNPDNNYRITAFTNGNDDINGRYLHLEHIQDPSLRPLDELFTDHFMQGLFKHMKGAGVDPEWTYEDYDNAFGEGSFNMSNPAIWGTLEGRRHFELALADRLFDHRMEQQTSGT
ncbi:hypothetical protein AX16_001696 [Volvariella volvacea WC 439]|nr:hypothetical protein AX16_001696 [Volvariella volvacea WC 439]